MSGNGSKNSTQASQRVFATVRQVRDALGLSAQALVDRCAADGYAISRSALAGMENGYRLHLSVDDLEALAKALGVSPGDLLSGDAPAVARTLRVTALRAEADRLEKEGAQGGLSEPV